jgi:hypothetical protein
MPRNESAPLDVLMILVAILWLASWIWTPLPPNKQWRRPDEWPYPVPYTERVDVVEEY